MHLNYTLYATVKGGKWPLPSLGKKKILLSWQYEKEVSVIRRYFQFGIWQHFEKNKRRTRRSYKRNDNTGLAYSSHSKFCTHEITSFCPLSCSTVFNITQLRTTYILRKEDCKLLLSIDLIELWALGKQDTRVFPLPTNCLRENVSIFKPNKPSWNSLRRSCQSANDDQLAWPLSDSAVSLFSLNLSNTTLLCISKCFLE